MEGLIVFLKNSSSLSDEGRGGYRVDFEGLK